VTYCPLCRTALAARRRVDGEVTRFDEWRETHLDTD
jgi:hypothetical protein